MQFTVYCLALLTFVSFPSLSQSEPLSLYEGSARAKVLGQEILFPLRVTAEKPAEEDDLLSLSAEAKIDPFFPVIASHLSEAISSNDKGCEERWSAWDGAVSVVENAMALAVTVRLERWLCTGLGKTRLARETGTIHASLIPSVIKNRLQLNLFSFRIDDLETLSRLFGLETIARKEIEKLISELNSDPSFVNPPLALKEVGFTYSDVALRKSPTGHSELVASVKGPNETSTLLRLIAEINRLSKK